MIGGNWQRRCSVSTANWTSTPGLCFTYSIRKVGGGGNIKLRVGFECLTAYARLHISTYSMWMLSDYVIRDILSTTHLPTALLWSTALQLTLFPPPPPSVSTLKLWRFVLKQLVLCAREWTRVRTAPYGRIKWNLLRGLMLPPRRCHLGTLFSDFT